MQNLVQNTPKKIGFSTLNKIYSKEMYMYVNGLVAKLTSKIHSER